MNKSLKKCFPIFVLPTLIAFAVAFVIPFFLGLYLSFTEFTTVTDSVFVGLKNYIEVFKSGDFKYSMLLTAGFVAVCVVTVNLIAFGLALALSSKLRGRNFYKTIFFMPNLIGGIVLGYIWQLILNGVLYKFSQSLTADPKYGFIGLVIIVNWQMIGYMMVIYIAGLSSVPPELTEAAAIDGAGSGRTLVSVILPSVMPSVTICLFLTITNSFKMFDQNLALTAGAPASKTELIALNIYNTFYGRSGSEGVGQAKAVIFSVVVAAVALLQLAMTKRREEQM